MLKTLTRSLYLISAAHLILELCINFLPIIYPLLITTMGLSYAQIGLIALVAGIGASLMQPLFGYVSDRGNPYRMIILSILWIGLLMGLVGFMWNYLSLIVLIGLASLGSAAFHPAGAVIAGASSTARRGAAISIFSVGGNLGSALSPLLIAAGLSWFGLQGTGILIPVVLLASLLLYKQWSGKSRLPVADPIAGPANHGGESRNLRRTGSLMGLILITFAVMCRSWFQISLVTYLPEWMHRQGWSLTVGGQILAVMLFSVSVGSLLGGTLSDRIGRWQVVALSLGLLSLTQGLFLAASGLVQVGLVGLIGVLIGASFPVAIAMAQETWPRGLGLASALVLGLGWLPGGIGAAFTGYLADQSSLGLGLQSLVLAPILGMISIVAYAILQRQASSHRPADMQA
jgi:FSR family fosmidomycin resistance protein-like MFS transporter